MKLVIGYEDSWPAREDYYPGCKTPEEALAKELERTDEEYKAEILEVWDTDRLKLISKEVILVDD